MSSFIQYNNILLDGFANHGRHQELVDKKHELLTSVLDYYNLNTDNILFVGFSPWCLGLKNHNFVITEVDRPVVDYLSDQQINFQYLSLSSLLSSQRRFTTVVAVDEYFTFANSDNDQRDLVKNLAELCDGIIVTTLRDYKNQDFKDREFSQPIMIKGSHGSKIYLEHFEYDIKEKNASQSCAYVIDDRGSQVHGPFQRRNMYFKQLAKFSLDVGATNFYVHKNLMYKSVIKKNYEHVITIKF